MRLEGDEEKLALLFFFWKGKADKLADRPQTDHCINHTHTYTHTLTYTTTRTHIAGKEIPDINAN